MTTATDYRTLVTSIIERKDFGHLTDHGFGTYHVANHSPEERKAAFARDREDLLSAESAVAFDGACVFLAECQPALRTASGRNGTSYGLKHVCEEWREYVRGEKNGYLTNGVFIVAAIHMGFPVTQIRVDRYRYECPNAYVGVSARALDRVNRQIMDAQRLAWNAKHLDAPRGRPVSMGVDAVH